jgi:ABC-type multidrug transport system fused ATPase/permease subunit
MRCLAALAVCFALTPHAFAQDYRLAAVEKWYAALASADRAAFETLISDSAVIELKDIGVTQTKREFIESLDEWQVAVKGATIRHKVESETGNMVIVRVCYTFSGNEIMNREDFKIEAGKVTGSVQMKIAGSCEAF